MTMKLMINFIMTNRACKKIALPLRDRQSFSVEKRKVVNSLL